MILRRGSIVSLELTDPPYFAAATYFSAPQGKVGTAFRRASRAVQASVELQGGNRGLLRYSIQRRFPGREFWTLTVWTEEAAMRSFVHSAAHSAAMQAVPDARSFGTFAHWVTVDPMVGWEEAYARLGQDPPLGWLLEPPGPRLPDSWLRPRPSAAGPRGGHA